MKEAFPRPFSKERGYEDGKPHDSQTGMTLRDYFAAKALQGSLNGCLCKDCGVIEERAREAYQIADAMLNEREK